MQILFYNSRIFVYNYITDGSFKIIFNIIFQLSTTKIDENIPTTIIYLD